MNKNALQQKGFPIHGKNDEPSKDMIALWQEIEKVID